MTEVTLYLHSDKSSNYETAEELGLTEEATEYFKYALYEVEFRGTIDSQGKFTCTHVNDVALVTPTVM